VTWRVLNGLFLPVKTLRALGALTLLGGVALLSASCAEAPQVRFYELAPPGTGGSSDLSVPSAPSDQSTQPTPSTPAAPAGEGVRLGVERFRVDSPYDQDRIVYRVASSPDEIGFYAYHRWATPLDRMLALATARQLESRPEVAVAEPADPDSTYDLLIGGRLLELDEVDGPDGEEARVEIELTLRAAGGGAEREVWRGRYRASASGTAVDVPAVVALMEQALADALGRGTTELVRHLDGAGVLSERHGAPPPAPPGARPR